jgi:hypothetical protein
LGCDLPITYTVIEYEPPRLSGAARLAAPVVAFLLRRTADEAAVRIAGCLKELAHAVG